MTVDIDHFGILTGEKDFSWALEKAREIGIELVTLEIQDLFISSEFFRESLAYDRLKPKAEEIQQKVSRREKDASFEYPFWQFKMDVFELKKEALKVGIDASYVNDLLKDPSLKPRDGSLLWYYSNHSEFMLQWILINSILLVLVVLSWLIPYKDQSLIKAVPASFRKTIVPADIISINGWVFWSKPDSMNILHWILPGIIFLVCFILSVFFEKF